MDASSLDHYSDSDSGESWTLVERCPSCIDEAPTPENSDPREEEMLEKENSDKDEDTDGISIISDSDPGNMTPCEHLNDYYNFSDIKDYHPIESNYNRKFSVVQDSSNNSKNADEPMNCDDDFLSTDTGKLKTYVHKRNKKLSTVLNVILLGSVITAAGVAIGHMWGVKDDCLMHSTSSVNKILSNLYKLQEENAALRNKIKELTNALQLQQKKSDIDKITSIKYPRCRKVFEESLDSNAVKFTKCVDFYTENAMDNDEQEYLSEINKLKAVYKQNKSWLDNEISRRLKDEEMYAKKPKEILKPIQTDLQDNSKVIKDMNLEILQPNTSEDTLDIINLTIENDKGVKEDKTKMENSKISYADSLKSSAETQLPQEEKNKINIEKSYEKKQNMIPHKKQKREVIDYEASLSDVQAKKDDRYMEHRTRQDVKKYDRQKAHKKQKRKNKYEQWEMNRGYIKDYDELPSTAYNDYILNKHKGSKNEEYERRNYMKQLSEIERKKYASQYFGKNVENTPAKDGNNKGKKGEDCEDKPDWLEMRAELRTAARKKLNQKLLGEDNLDSARWYFRRMQRREQCRSKDDNITRRKYPKQHMNKKDKTKHTG
ncbi:hypothetical protein EVAR_2822_1 [Eumeta japonica]|uniref:Uncharacterized protein n=1 Tax=Eumeta variegata TaxID=151549 RepID=A0A4C1T0J7_EUMVA|nr:hypothetical protein EVAR_2822_1 [Eumeta japonica]